MLLTQNISTQTTIFDNNFFSNQTNVLYHFFLCKLKLTKLSSQFLSLQKAKTSRCALYHNTITGNRCSLLRVKKKVRINFNYFPSLLYIETNVLNFLHHTSIYTKKLFLLKLKLSKS